MIYMCSYFCFLFRYLGFNLNELLPLPPRHLRDVTYSRPQPIFVYRTQVSPHILKLYSLDLLVFHLNISNHYRGKYYFGCSSLQTLVISYSAHCIPHQSHSRSFLNEFISSAIIKKIKKIKKWFKYSGKHWISDPIISQADHRPILYSM